MQWFNDLALARKFLLVLSATVAFFAVIGLTGYIGIQKVDDSADTLYRRELVPIGEVGEMGKDFQRIRANLAFLMLTTTKAESDHDRDVVIRLTRDMDTLGQAFRTTITSGETEKMFEQYSRARDVFLPLQTRILSLLEAGDRKTAQFVFLNDARNSEHDIENAIDNLRELKRRSAEESLLANESIARTATVTLVVSIAVAITLSVLLTLWVAKLVTKPLRMLGEVLETLADDNLVLTEDAGKIAAGDTSFQVENRRKEVFLTQKDEVGRLAESAKRIVDSQERLAKAFTKVTETLDALIGETSALSTAAVDGKLSTRGNIERFQGGYRDIVNGINRTLDAFLGPLNTAARYVDAISRGEIPPKITENYNGDFATIKDNLNGCIEAVNALVADANMLSVAAVRGELSTRADENRHKGDFRKVVEGVNATLDSVIDPLKVSASVLTQIGKGEVPKKIDARYAGDFAEIEKSLNNCIDGLEGLKEGAFVMSRLAVNDLTQSVKGKYEGIFGEVAMAVNTTQQRLSSMVSMVEEISQGRTSQRDTLRALGRQSEEDVLIPSFIRLYDSVGRLAKEVIALADKATEGDLSARANAEGLQGEFLTMVTGLNGVLDVISRPIDEGGRVLQGMASGDLTIRMTGEYKGDHRRLKESINGVGDSLEAALMEVDAAVGAVASASAQISSSTEEMAAGAQEQTSQTSEVAGAVEEMAKTIIENSRNAASTADVAKQAKDAAEQGGNAVEEMLSGMRQIEIVVEQSSGTVQKLGQSSDQIGDIVIVIDDIADQTNLLALNAAIEAARAGDQGRGFAVVADEVRKLAERTTTATKEIATMIKKIQADTKGAVYSMQEGTKKVADGILLADKAGISLKQIVEVSQKVTDMVMQIATASEEQSSASEQISKNVDAISTVASQTASGSQQIARAAEDLNQLTERLQQLTGKFIMKQSTGKHHPRHMSSPVHPAGNSAEQHETTGGGQPGNGVGLG